MLQDFAGLNYERNNYYDNLYTNTLTRRFDGPHNYLGDNKIFYFTFDPGWCLKI